MIADRYGLLATFWFLAGTIVVANLFILRCPASAGGGLSRAGRNPRPKSFPVEERGSA